MRVCVFFIFTIDRANRLTNKKTPVVAGENETNTERFLSGSRKVCVCVRVCVCVCVCVRMCVYFWRLSLMLSFMNPCFFFYILCMLFRRFVSPALSVS